MFQLIIVITILLIALLYAAWRIRMVIKNAGGRCYGCPIKDACSKKMTRNFLRTRKVAMKDQKNVHKSLLQARTAKKKG